MDQRTTRVELGSYMWDISQGREEGRQELAAATKVSLLLPADQPCHVVHAVPSHTALLHRGRARNQEEE